jgi:hypothetical protein
MKTTFGRAGTNLMALTLFLAQTLAADPPAFVTPLTQENLESSAFAAWVDSREQPVALKNGPRHVTWTQTSQPEWDGVTFGESKTSGVTHRVTSQHSTYKRLTGSWDFGVIAGHGATLEN